MLRNEENREYAKSFLDGPTADLLVLSGHPHHAIIHLGFRLEKGGGRRRWVENTALRFHCYSSVTFRSYLGRRLRTTALAAC